MNLDKQELIDFENIGFPIPEETLRKFKIFRNSRIWYGKTYYIGR